MAKMRYTQEQIIQAIEASEYGTEAEIADTLGCTTKTLRNYRKRFEEIEESFALRKDRLNDWVESKLFTEIKHGNIAAIIFYLKTQCKTRGYVERQEVTGAGGGPIVVDWDEGEDE